MKLKKIFNHKFLLNCCNFIFLICGFLLLFSGFYLFSDTKRILLSRILVAASDQLSQLPHPLFYYVSLGLAVAGTIAILSAIIGFWASCLNTYCFLSLYFITVIILLLAESAACLAITIWPQCLGLNLDETKMVKALQGYYGVPEHEQFTLAIDLTQTQFKCCGISSDINYDTSMWRLQGYGPREWTVPLSCCILENRDETKAYLDPKPKNATQCQALQRFDYEKVRHTESCLEKLDGWYREQYILFLFASLAIALVEFCVLLSIILNCTKIPKRKRSKIEIGGLDLTSRSSSAQKPRQEIIENLYHSDVQFNARAQPTTTNLIPSDVKEIYVQPPDLYQTRHNTTFKPSRNQYHISKGYLV